MSGDITEINREKFSIIYSIEVGLSSFIIDYILGVKLKKVKEKIVFLLYNYLLLLFLELGHWKPSIWFISTVFNGCFPRFLQVLYINLSVLTSCALLQNLMFIIDNAHINCVVAWTFLHCCGFINHFIAFIEIQSFYSEMWKWSLFFIFVRREFFVLIWVLEKIFGALCFSFRVQCCTY